MARTWLLRTHLEGSFQKRCTEQNPPNNYDVNSHGTITLHDMKTPDYHRPLSVPSVLLGTQLLGSEEGKEVGERHLANPFVGL